MNNKERSLAIVIQSEVQYYAVAPLLEELNEKGYDFDILVNTTKFDNSGSEHIALTTYGLLRKKGYNPLKVSKTETYYKILLTPFPEMVSAPHKYLLRYLYAPISAKPEPIYSPENQMHYHGLLVQSFYEKDALEVYAKTHLVSNLKYVNFRKKKNNSTKKKLLYLPTYGDVSSVEGAVEALRKLKSDYILVAKTHHGTTHLNDEGGRRDALRGVSDEYYESDKPLSELLEEADVVLSDNSGAIFEALYVGLPVAIYSDKLNDRKIGRINTLQYSLVRDGVIPHTNDSSEIERIIKDAMGREYREAQAVKRKELFPDIKDPLKSWLEAIDYYLRDEVNQEYIALHDIYIGQQKLIQEKARKDGDTINDMTLEIERNRAEIDGLTRDLQSFYSGRAYRLATFFYKVKSKIIRK